jgi:hypothetical protein
MFIFVITVFSGCNSNVQDRLKSVKNGDEYLIKLDENMKEVDYKVIKSAQVPYDQEEYQYGKKESVVYYSDNQKDLSKFKIEYKKLTGEDAPEFDGTMIILKMGAKSTGGYEIKIDKVLNSDRYILLQANFINPPKGSLVTMSLTNPYKIIYIPHSHKEVKVDIK